MNLNVSHPSHPSLLEGKKSTEFFDSPSCEVVNCPEGNHNWFRISRVLVSLRLLGLIDEVFAES